MTDKSSPGPPWRYRIGTQINDNGYTWIVTKNLIGIRRWIKIKTSKLIKIREFEVNRNNSIIVPKANEYITLCITKTGHLYLVLSSRYIPEADEVVINEHLSKLNIGINYAKVGNA